MRRNIPTRWRRQSGQSLLETTVTIVVIFAVVFWVFELGWFMYTYSVLADAANEGVRYSIVHSGGDVPGTITTVQAFAATSLHNISGMTTSVTFPDGPSTPPNRVRVTVSYQFVPYLPQFFTAVITMNAYAEGRRVVQ
jgi:Flp pilus assembly protein TadG